MTTSSDADDSIHTWKRCRGDPQEDRLWAAMLDAERRLTAQSKLRGSEDRIVIACRECLRQAVKAAKEIPSARYVAWDCLHQFDAEMLEALTDAERQARWCSLRAEAEEKLKGGWRSQAADCLVKQATEWLDKQPADKKFVPMHLVRELQAHLATAAQNQQHKFELFQRQSLPWLSWLLGAAVAAAVVFSLAVFALDGSGLLRPWAQALMLGIPAGALGGIVSMAFAFGRVDLKAKIPDMRLSRRVTLTRPLLGATVAIPILVFIEAGYVTVAGFTRPLAIAAFCFLGGFSERWFLGLMERFEGGKK